MIEKLNLQKTENFNGFELMINGLIRINQLIEEVERLNEKIKSMDQKFENQTDNIWEKIDDTKK